VISEPLLLSLRVAAIATLLALLVGVALAALFARWRSWPLKILEALTLIPLVLPPTVLGYFLLVGFGARSPVGQALEQLGLQVIFSWRGAVLAAAIVALPLVIQTAKSAFEGIDPRIHDVARTLGRSEASIFFSVTIPLAWRGILAGTVLAFARALGEFGATLMLAGNIPGKTQTLPLAIYTAVQSGQQAEANSLALLLSAVALLALIAIQLIGQGISSHE
jgi:molybdate transport system permease protein